MAIVLTARKACASAVFRRNDVPSARSQSHSVLTAS